MTHMSTSGSARPAQTPDAGRTQLWLTWLLTLLTVPVAAAVMLYAYGSVLGVAGCPSPGCAHPGPLWFGILAYAPPLIVTATIVMVSLVGSRRHGIWIPVLALGVLLIDLASLAFSFQV